MTLAALREAIDRFAHEQDDSPFLVNAAVVIWEEVASTDDQDADGGVVHRITYSVPAGSSASAIGLARVGEEIMLRDLADDEDV